MSSTCRGTERNKNDYYVTPHWLITELLPILVPAYNIDITKPTFDPSAGGCGKHEMSYPKVLKDFGFTDITTADIRADSRAANPNSDYFKSVNFGYDLIITNPPFDRSVEFAKKAIREVNDNGHVVMLQRLNWLGTAKRKPFWDAAPLKHVYIHHKRPAFNPELPNKHDSIEYAHFVFQKGYTGSTELEVI